MADMNRGLDGLWIPVRYSGEEYGGRPYMRSGGTGRCRARSS
jgi:hypothetical protein